MVLSATIYLFLPTLSALSLKYSILMSELISKTLVAISISKVLHPIASQTASYSPVTAIGAACTDEVYTGLTLAIDLVFSSKAIIDLEAGFEFSFPKGAYITVHPFTGHNVDRCL